MASDGVAEAAELPLEDAKLMLRDLFRVMSIERVVVVDDQLSDAPDVSDLIAGIRAKVSAGDGPSLASVKVVDSIDFAAPPAVWDRQIRAVWHALDAIGQSRLLEELSIPTGPVADDKGRNTLARIIEGYELRFLSLPEWVVARGELIATAATRPTLFLFDQDMTGNQGAPDEGMKTIAALLKEGIPPPTVYFGLFSNTIDPNVEHEDHIKFARDYDVWSQRNRFAVISKQHLNTHPKALAFRLKRVAISPWCEALKSRLVEAISGAVRDAQQRLEGLDVYDFEQIVFQSSYREGVWEADTLLRLFGLFHRDAARTRAKGDPALIEAADKVRSVIAYPYKPEDFPSSQARKISQLELYEEEDYLLAHRMPLDVGDIFQKTGGKGRYLLLEQPCDLMVRGDTGRRKAEEIMLAAIVEQSRESRPRESYVELPFFSEDEQKTYFVDLSACVAVQACILDLAVLSDNGSSSLEIGAACPDGLIPSWQKRYELLQERGRKLLERYRSLTQVDGANGTGIRRDADLLIQASLTGSVAGVVSGSIKGSPDRVEYSLKRIRRLKQPRAGSVLREYAYFKARDAFDHDLTRSY